MSESLIDTHERPAAPPEAEDALAVFRAQVRQEMAEEQSSKPRLSEAAAARLRAIREQDKADKIATESFAEQFRRLPKDIWTLVQMLKRIYSSDQNAWTTAVIYDADGCVLSVTPVRKAPQMTDNLLERMADKIRWSLQHGWTVASISDVVFAAALTEDEKRMSDERFISHLEGHAAKNPAPLSRPTTVEEAPKIIKKAPYWNEARCSKNNLCKAGSLCLKASNSGKPAPAAEGRQYCGTACQGTYPVRREREQLRALAA
jgi:hypothetical protein